MIARYLTEADDPEDAQIIEWFLACVVQPQANRGKNGTST
jgi:hypothetical protein